MGTDTEQQQERWQGMGGWSMAAAYVDGLRHTGWGWEAPDGDLPYTDGMRLDDLAQAMAEEVPEALDTVLAADGARASATVTYRRELEEHTGELQPVEAVLLFADGSRLRLHGWHDGEASGCYALEDGPYSSAGLADAAQRREEEAQHRLEGEAWNLARVGWQPGSERWRGSWADAVCREGAYYADTLLATGTAGGVWEAMDAALRVAMEAAVAGAEEAVVRARQEAAG